MAARGTVYRRKDSKRWWVKYYSASGKPLYESSGSERKKDAVDLLNRRLGEIGKGHPVTPKIGKFTVEDGLRDVILDFETNGKKSLAVVRRRIEKHLLPFFAGRRMATLTTSEIREFIRERQTTPSVLVRKARTIVHPDRTRETLPEERRPASNAEINRELALLKRAYSLAIKDGKLLHRPHIPMLRESNPRSGFFDVAQVEAVLRHLPEDVRPIVEFAFITGWRIASEVLSLEWRQVDFGTGEIRLDPGTTKNGHGRVFRFDEHLRLRTLMQELWRRHLELRQQGHMASRVFVRMVATGRGGPVVPRPIASFTKAWKAACAKAGCPGRIPHDLRRSAVRNLVRTGTSENTAMELSGHRTRSVFDRYNITDDSDRREAIRRLNALYGANPHAAAESEQNARQRA